MGEVYAPFVMELVEGPTLAERIARGPMPLEEALPIALQIIEALEYASARVTWRGADMIGVTTMTEMSNRLRQAVAEAKPGETVYTTVGWRIPDGHPNRQDLDQISPSVTIVAVRGRRGAMTVRTPSAQATAPAVHLELHGDAANDPWRPVSQLAFVDGPRP